LGDKVDQRFTHAQDVAHAAQTESAGLCNLPQNCGSLDVLLFCSAFTVV
jgi:hypothetical protein